MNQNQNQNRSLLAAAAIGLAVVAVAALVGCSSTTETVSSAGTSTSSVPKPTAAPTTAAVSPPTTDADPSAPDVTDTTATPTIPASGGDPVLVGCGTVHRASGWPTTFPPSPQAFTCLAGAFGTGTPARLVDREQTDGEGGAILVTTYDVLGSGRVRVTVDAREAADRAQTRTVSECTDLRAELTTVTVSACTVVGS